MPLYQTQRIKTPNTRVRGLRKYLRKDTWVSHIHAVTVWSMNTWSRSGSHKIQESLCLFTSARVLQVFLTIFSVRQQALVSLTNNKINLVLEKAITTDIMLGIPQENNLLGCLFSDKGPLVTRRLLHVRPLDPHSKTQPGPSHQQTRQSPRLQTLFWCGLSRKFMDKHPAKKVCMSGTVNTDHLAQSTLFRGIEKEDKKPVFRSPDVREQVTILVIKPRSCSIELCMFWHCVQWSSSRMPSAVGRQESVYSRTADSSWGPCSCSTH